MRRKRYVKGNEYLATSLKKKSRIVNKIYFLIEVFLRAEVVDANRVVALAITLQNGETQVTQTSILYICNS